jgi:hypothetical protein
MASIEIDYACTGTTVPNLFTAKGTWALDSAGAPAVTCELDNGTGGLFASASSISTTSDASHMSGTWTAVFNLNSIGSSLSLNAALGGTAATDQQTDITVQNNPPLVVTPPGIPPAIERRLVIYTVSGSYTATAGIGVVCLAVVHQNKKDTDVLDLKAALGFNPTQNPVPWSVDLKFDPSRVPQGAKIGVRVILIDATGKIVARVHLRSPKKP